MAAGVFDVVAHQGGGVRLFVQPGVSRAVVDEMWARLGAMPRRLEEAAEGSETSAVNSLINRAPGASLPLACLESRLRVYTIYTLKSGQLALWTSSWGHQRRGAADIPVGGG